MTSPFRYKLVSALAILALPLHLHAATAASDTEDPLFKAIVLLLVSIFTVCIAMMAARLVINGTWREVLGQLAVTIGVLLLCLLAFAINIIDKVWTAYRPEIIETSSALVALIRETSPAAMAILGTCALTIILGALRWHTKRRERSGLQQLHDLLRTIAMANEVQRHCQMTSTQLGAQWYTRHQSASAETLLAELMPMLARVKEGKRLPPQLAQRHHHIHSMLERFMLELTSAKAEKPEHSPGLLA